MKRLVLEVKTELTTGVKWVRILSQTHIGNAFAERTRYLSGDTFMSQDGFRLVSMRIPEVATNKPHGFEGLYVFGSDRESNHIAMTVPSEDWLIELRAAVREYNTAHGSNRKYEVLT